jgi:hypothetical protein
MGLLGIADRGGAPPPSRPARRRSAGRAARHRRRHCPGPDRLGALPLEALFATTAARWGHGLRQGTAGVGSPSTASMAPSPVPDSLENDHAFGRPKRPGPRRLVPQVRVVALMVLAATCWRAWRSGPGPTGVTLAAASGPARPTIRDHPRSRLSVLSPFTNPIAGPNRHWLTRARNLGEGRQRLGPNDVLVDLPPSIVISVARTPNCPRPSRPAPFAITGEASARTPCSPRCSTPPECRQH